jgi:hypothetical protein
MENRVPLDSLRPARRAGGRLNSDRRRSQNRAASGRGPKHRRRTEASPLGSQAVADPDSFTMRAQPLKAGDVRPEPPRRGAYADDLAGVRADRHDPLRLLEWRKCIAGTRRRYIGCSGLGCGAS